MSKYDDFYSNKSVIELLEKLKEGRISPEMIDKEWFDALINHLNARELSESEKKLKEHILSADLATLKKDLERDKSIQKVEEKATSKSSVVSTSEISRYTALKSVIGLISILGYVVLVAGLVALLYLFSNNQAAIGLMALVISLVIALPLLAYANLIYVFIDIEFNTRKTREALK